MHNDDYVTTLHPPGSANDFQIEMEKRVLIRPKINFFKAALITIFVVLADALIGMGVSKLLGNLSIMNMTSENIGWSTSIILLLVFLFFARKAILLWFIHIYQRYAPDHVRLQCVFTPSCSEYMILSIKKYGVIVGVYKGVKRIKRCHAPNGGEDHP